MLIGQLNSYEVQQLLVSAILYHPTKKNHFNSIKAASEIISAISKENAGEANLRFTASANCPAGIPFFPAAFYGKNSFALRLESANLVTEAFKNSNKINARQNLKTLFENNLGPFQDLVEGLAKNYNWQYDGIDVSPAPGLDASIGQAIEEYSKQPFGSPSTLSACALITDVLKKASISKKAVILRQACLLIRESSIEPAFAGRHNKCLIVIGWPGSVKYWL